MLENTISPSTCAPVVKVDNKTIITMATRSSTTSIPKTILVKACSRMDRSVNAFIMMVVDDMESIQPKNRLSMDVHPKKCPVR